MSKKTYNPRAAFLLATMVLWQVGEPLQAADRFWDPGLTGGTTGGGTGTWDNLNTGNWWDGAGLVQWNNASIDLAIFGNTSGLVTLGGPITAGGLRFNANGYIVTGDTITLAGASTLQANLAESATINSLIAGSSGLTMLGGGSIRLGNALNSYTGATTIANGSLIISDGGALGTDPSVISILSTNNTPLNTNLIGFGGGSLVLDGTAAGFTFGRNVNLEGRGPIGDRGAAIQSLGNNTLSGVVTTAISPLPLSPTASIRNSRINSVNGTLTFSGTLNAGGTAGTTFTALGGVNSAGVSNFDLTGALSGTGSIEKSGAGTLFLNPSDTSNFAGTVRIGGSATGQQSSVRVTQASVGGQSIFGTNTTTGTAANAIDMNGGVLEFRNEGDLNINANAGGKNVYHRANSTFYTGPGVGGQGINGLTTLGTFRLAANTTATFNSRNGYGFTLGTWTQESSNNNSTITNNMGGTLTFTGSAWNNNDGSARTLTINGNGNTVILGNINASDTGKNLAKAGTGLLTLRATGTTLTGNVSVQQGAMAITDFRSINMHTAVGTGGAGTLNLGSNNNTGNLIIGTATAATAAGLGTSKTISLAGTTGGAGVFANQAGSNPVLLNGTITVNGTANKTLTLGGTNTADNLIAAGIPAMGAGGVTKVGSGTWVLAGTNTYTGATSIINGTLKLRADAAASTILAATSDITFGNANGFAGGTFEFVGQAGVNNVQVLDVLTTSSGANTIRLTPVAGGTASLTFASQATAGAGTVNFVGADFVNNKITITGANGLVGRTNYWDGADFAYRQSNVLRAPVYGTDAGFVTSTSALTAASNNEITGSFATNTLAINTLKIVGNNTLTLNAAQTLTLSGGGLLATGGDSIITGGTALALGAQTLVVRTNLNTDSVDIQSTITGTGGLTKSGAGTLILSGVNAQTGVVTINEGTVQLSGSGRLGAAAALTMRQGTVLDLNGVTPSTVTNAFSNNGSVTSASPATFTVGGANGTGTSYGTVDGAISLTKTGTGAQSWLGSSTYTGVTTIGSTGLVTVDTLAIGGTASGIGASSSAASNLVFDGSTGGLVYQGNIVDPGSLLTLGSRSATTDRLFTLAAAATGATLSSTVSNNNAVIWSNTGAIVNNTTAAATLIFGGSSAGDNTFNPQLVDSSVATITLGINKTGSGQWNLGNSGNTYTGITTVTEGILGLNNTAALPTGSPLVLGSNATTGILQASGVFARDLSATPTAGIGTISFGGTTGGGGFAAHSGPLTVTLNSGAGLTWGSGGFVGTGGVQALSFNSASALADVTFTNAIALNPGVAVTPEVTTTDASAVVTTADTTGLVIGQPISGPGIPAGAVIASITNGTTFVISANATTALGAGTGPATIDFATRNITVNDNGNTGADYATLSGVISGAGGSLLKTGAGVLRLTGANSYEGTTRVEAGTIIVSSLGSSTGGPTSSVGASGVPMGNNNAIVLGNAQGTGGLLQYVGPGETSDRLIRLRGTGASNQIHADGSGPLILTEVRHDTAETGNKTLFLRGSNAEGNQITSALTDNGAGVLSVTVDGGATWILTGANTYTGGTTAGAGALGIGNAAALGTGALINSNGNVFAYGADRTIANAVTLSNNATNGWLGDYSLTVSGVTNFAAGANNVNTYNSIAAGKTLTFAGGITANALTANRTWTFDGSGETVIGGTFTTTSTAGVPLTKNGNGILTLGTDGALSNWNSNNNVIDVDRGTLAFSANNAIPTTYGATTVNAAAAVPVGTTTFTVPSTADLRVGQLFSGTNVPAGSRIASIIDGTTFTTTTAPTTEVASGVALTFVASGGLTISPELATTDTARVDLRGTTQTVNALTATTDGTVIIDNTSSSPATFRFGANNATVNFGNGIGSYTIQDTGTGALSIVKLGNTSTTFGTGVTLDYQGATRVEGGTLTFGGLVGGTTALEVVNSGSVLALTGGIANASSITSVVVEDGGTLSLLDGNGNKLDSLTSLTLGSTGGTLTTLNLNVGDGVTAGDFAKTDTLKLLTGGSLSLFANNQIQFNLTDAGLNENTTYTLLEVADGGLTSGPLSGLDYLLGGAPGGFASVTLNKTNNTITVTTGALITGDLYWTGTTDNAWNGNTNNWSTDKAGTLASASLPGQGTDVKFAADSLVGGAALTTTLEQNIKIRTLTFEGSTDLANTPGTVTINSGTVATNRLEIAPGASTNGISLAAGGPAVVNLNSAVTLGKDQTWNVAEGVGLTGGSYANGSANVTVASTVGLRPGMVVSGPGIPLGATVASVTDATTFVLSANTTAASGTGGPSLTAVQSLNVTGALDGAGALTKTGAGRVVLGSAASSLFTSPLVTVNGGQLEMAAANALGSLANANLATIQMDAGGTFYFNSTTAAGTTANPLNLNGGTLSAAGSAQTYSGTVNVGSASTVQMLDQRSLNAARNITLSGAVSGNGAITVDSVATVSGGNQLNGTLTLNNAGNTWSGDLFFNRGTVQVNNTASPNFLANNVTFNSFGRLNLQGLNGATQTRTGTITYGAGAIGEFGVDNTGATVNADYTVNQAGAITLGAGSGMRVFLSDAFSKMNITGGVTLGGNGSISLGGDAAGLLNISSVISDGGSGFALAINDDLGGWGTTNRTVRLSALNTFTGNFTLGEGVAEYDTITNISGGASSLGNGTAITISGGNLRFIGSSNQSTDRPVTITTASTLSNNSANGSTVTFDGLITNTGTADGSQLILTGLAGNQGFIRGGISQTGNEADMTVNGGTWNHELQVSRIGDDLTVTGATTVMNLNSGLLQVRDDFTVTAGATLNLNGANALSFNVTTLSADASLRATNGGVINLGASDAIDSVQFDGLRIGTDAGGAAGVLNLNGFNQTVAEFLLGNRNLDRTGTVNGTGTLTITGNVDLFEGEINANLASTGINAFDKIGGNETVILRGDNSGLTSTGASAVYAGTLVLDYTVSNTVKLRELSNLDLRGGKLQMIGNNSGATTQSVATLTLGSGGASVIEVDGGTGQTAVLNFGGITRGTNANDGTIRFILPGGAQDATNGITTTATLTNGLLGVSGFATVEDGTGTYFATTSGTNVVGLISTPKNDVTTWLAGDHITDETTGFTGISTGASINSLRFNAAGGSNVNLATGGSLGVTTGGILVTNNVGGTPGILGGTLASGALGGQVPELIITQDSAQSFEISSAIGVNHAITKSGNGTLLLSGTNLYTGYTDILQGTLEVTGGNAIGDTSTVILDDNRNTTFRLLNSETIGRLEGGRRADGEDNGIVDIGSNLLTLNHAGANTTFSGRFVGSGGLVLSAASDSNLNLQGVSSGFTGTLVVNGGLFQLSNVGAINATSITINSGGNLLLDNNGGTRSGTRILDSTAIALNSAAGTFGGTTIPRGLAIRTDQNATTNETIGNLTFDSGANYASLEASGGSSAQASLIANGWIRNNAATINVRGRNLGATADANGRSQFKVADANDAAMIAANVGGGAVTTPLTVLTTSGDATLTLSTGTTAGLVVGQGIFGTGIGAGATIVSIDSPTQVTVSVPSTATTAPASPITATAFLGGGGVRRTATVATVNASATLTLTTGNTDGFAVGQAITGTGIGAGATIVSIDSATQLTVSVPSTATSAAATPITATAFSRNNPIIPWAIGESLTAGVNNGNVGNTLMTYVDNQGLRPLNLTNEYATFGGAIPTDNIRESLTSDLTGLAATTLNSLVINNNNAVAPISVTGSGALQTLTNTSGAFLFTVTGGQVNTNYSTTLGGFDSGISVGTTNEYVIHVVNPSSAGVTPELTGVATTSGSTNVTVASTTGLLPGMFVVGDGIPAGATVASVTNGTTFVLSAAATATATGLTFASATPPRLTATIASPLASNADITKSGRGTLVLNQVNTAGGGANKTTVNEGILEIADLDNMGGDTGALVFAGGTLRLGTGFTDDLSLRTISLLTGGATLDTNGNDLALANSLGSGVGGFTKAGAGNLTLNSAATFTGPTVLNAGTITIGASNALGVGGDLTLNGGTTLALGNFNVSRGLVTLSGLDSVLTGTGTITASTGFFFNNTTTDTLTNVDAVLAGAGGLRKGQGNTLVLNGLNTYAGPTEIQAGAVNFSSIGNVGGGASSFGAPATVANGIIRLGLTTANVVLNYSGTGHSSNRVLGLQGTTGGLTLNANGAGGVNFGVVSGLMAGAKTLTLDGSADAALLNSINGIVEGAATITLEKNGLSTWAITGAGTHSGLTTVNGGVLRISNSAALGSTTIGTVIADGATLQLAGGISVGAETLSITGSGATGQAGALVNLSGSNSFAGPITALSPLTISLEGGALTLGALTGTDFGLTTLGLGDLTVGGDLLLGTGTITKNNTGLLVLSGNNVFTGGLALNAGTVEAGSAGALGTGGTITLAGGTLRHGAANTVDYSARFASGDGTAYKIETAGQSVTYATPLTGAGSTLSKAGAGTLVLNAVNTFDGRTTVTGGALSISSEENLGVAPAAFVADQLLLDGGTLETTANFAIDDANRGITLGALGGTFFTAPSTQLTLISQMTGAGQLTKDGAGTLLLSTASTHTGGTVVVNGKLLLGVNDAITGAVTVSGSGNLDIGTNSLTVSSLTVSGTASSVSGTGSISSAANFAFSPSGTATISNVLAGTGGITMSGTGTAILTGDNTYTGATTISSGALLLGGGSIASTATVSVASAATFGGFGEVNGPVVLADGTGLQAGEQAVLNVGGGFVDGLNVLDLNGDLTTGLNSIIDFYLTRTGFTQLNVDGAFNLTPSTRFRVNLSSGYIPSAGSSWDLLDWGTLNLNGAFDLVSLLLPLPTPGGVGVPDWVTTSFNTDGVLSIFGPRTGPAITTDPVGGVVNAGDSVTFSIAVTGSDPLQIQWYKGPTLANPIPGANGLTYTIPSAAGSDSGEYWAQVKNGPDTVNSQLAVLDVVTVPRITVQPTGATLFPSPGQDKTFSVTAIGPGPLTYVWKKATVAISGAPDDDEYTIEDVEVTDSGNYTVTVSNSFGSVTSDVAVLTVNAAIAFTTQPQTPLPAVPEGNDFTLTAAVTGEGPFTYQWEFDPAGGTVAFAAISGAESPTLTRNVEVATLGNYRLVVNNAYTSLTSNQATIGFGAVQVVVTSQPISKIVALGSTLTLDVGTSGGKPQKFQWYFKNKPVGDETDATLRIEDVTSARAGEYFCRISNALVSGSTTVDTQRVMVAVVDRKPGRFVVTQPGTVSLSVTATADKLDPLTYQWFVDDGLVSAPNVQPVAGATLRTLKVTNLTAGRKRFFCRVSAGSGSRFLDGGDNLVFIYTQPPALQPEGTWNLPDTVVSQPYSYQVPMVDNPLEAGQPDPLKMPVSFKATGLPPGLTINSAGLISGRATVERIDKITKAVIPYTVTITATNKLGTTTPIIKNLLVTPLNTGLIGDFTGPVDRNASLNSNLGGMINFKTTKTGSYSGSLTMGAKAYPFKGNLNSAISDPTNPSVTVKVSRGTTLRPLLVSFKLNSAGFVTGPVNPLTRGTITDGRTIAQFDGWRNTWLVTSTNKTPALAYSGYYTMGLDIPLPLQGTTTNPSIPQGTGYASFTVSSTTGKMTVSGKLADGTAFTTATYVGPTGEVLVYRALYGTTATSTRGSVLGKLQIDQVLAADTTDNTLTGTVSWWKVALTPSTTTAGRTYAAGFGPFDLSVVGSRYLPPLKGFPVLGLAPNATTNNARLNLVEANSEASLPVMTGSPANTVSVRVDNASKVFPDVLNNPRKVSMTITSATGLVSFKFSLSQPHPFNGTPATIARAVSGVGMIVRNGTEQQAWGYFMLPQLPSSFSEKTTATKILSGQAVFEKIP